ncbi:response regulator [Methylogaea oryzae]|uniref:DNA-binding response regulator n=1 Tax=Methylogaea oryzae TaxID=1295382 RepID=A0A8D4VLQ4_9GAMM|nr:response regulator [Methylogaea oryzae]BBL69437.1 DNA-binding response regulator [Methylogaea oryzae]
MTDEEPLVLVIEDDPQTRRVLRTSLGGLGWQVAEANSGDNGLAQAKSRPPDVVILDLGLPDMDGVAVVRAIRKNSEVPIIILSARSQEGDKIRALDTGADDYLSKPFSAGELEARLRALLRRAAKNTANRELFQVDDLTVDLTLRKVCLAECEIRLSRIEYRLLAVLIRNAGLVVTHRQLLREVWGPSHVHDAHYVRVYMAQLRHKLEADPARPHYLLTEVGVGYRLRCGNDFGNA